MRNSIVKELLSRFAALPRSGGGVRAVKLALCAVLLAASAGAQSSANWRIDTFAGLPDVRDNGPATDARLDFPEGMATDSAGNLFIADRINYRIRMVDSAGTISTIAGTGEQGFGGDGGTATDARLGRISGVARVEHSQAKLEGLLEGLREAITVRASAS